MNTTRPTPAEIEDLKRRASEEAAKVTRDVENRARQIAGAVHETLRDALGSDPAELATGLRAALDLTNSVPPVALAANQ